MRSLDIRGLELTVKRAAAKMAQKYFLRLSRRRVVCPEDLKNVGWVRVFSKIRHITTLRPCNCVKMKDCTHRRGYVYRLVCNAIHDEMRYIFTSGDEAVRLTPQGTIDAGAKDSSYDGGPTVFGTDESAPAAAVPSCEYWTPPVVWDEWQRMRTRGRTKLTVAAGFSAVETVNDYGGRSKFLVAAQWREIPWDMQEAITAVWLETARGVLRTNKHANGTRPRNPFGFASRALPHPDELGRITPPRLRAIALLVYGAGFYSDREINSSEIAKVVGLSGRTVQRDHAELLKLWGRYARASVDEKRDKNRFPRYPLHDDVAREFVSLPGDAMMPDSSNPVLTSTVMPSGRLRSLHHRMKKYHTDFSDATVTGIVVAPRASIYACRPDNIFRIIGRFDTPVVTADNPTQTIDSFWDGRNWYPIRVSDKGGMPQVWLHDWTEHQLFGDKPRKSRFTPCLTTQRSIAPALYPREASEEKPSYCNCALCVELRHLDRLFFDEAHAGTRATFGKLAPYSTIEDEPRRRNVLRVGVLHGQSSGVSKGRYRITHFLGSKDGGEIWSVEEYGVEKIVRTPVTTPPVFFGDPVGTVYTDSRTVAEIIADYTSKERKRYQKEFAADNESARAHTAWLLANKELTREVDARIRAAIIAAEQRRREENAA